jgi:hypothetical protein
MSAAFQRDTGTSVYQTCFEDFIDHGGRRLLTQATDRTEANMGPTLSQHRDDRFCGDLPTFRRRSEKRTTAFPNAGAGVGNGLDNRSQLLFRHVSACSRCIISVGRSKNDFLAHGVLCAGEPEICLEALALTWHLQWEN